MVIVDPTADLPDQFGGHRLTRGARLAECDAEVPYRSVAFAASALAVRVAAGEIPLHEGAAKNLSERGQKFRQALTPLVQREGRDSG